MKQEFLKLEKRPLHTKGIPKPQLRKGQKVEKEHTECPRIAKQIATDHLHEGTNYYQELEKMEEKLDKKGSLATELDTLQKVEAWKKNKPKLKPLRPRIKQAFETGFIKRAVEHGLTAGEAVDLLKKSEIPPLDLSNYPVNYPTNHSHAAATLGSLIRTGALMGAGGIAGNYIGKGLTTNPENEKRNKTLGRVGGALSAPLLMNFLTQNGL